MEQSPIAAPAPELLSTKRPHPLLLGAAASVLVFSLLGSAAVVGWLPAAHPEKSEALLQQEHRSNKIASNATSCLNCGTVSAIHTVRVKGDTSGTGAIAGGVTGALVGSQIGNGNGKTAMTVVGAAGGAYAGNEIERSTKTQTVYRVTVQMDDGSYRTVSQSAPPSYIVGDKVRVMNGGIASRV